LTPCCGKIISTRSLVNAAIAQHHSSQKTNSTVKKYQIVFGSENASQFATPSDIHDTTNGRQQAECSTTAELYVE